LQDLFPGLTQTRLVEFFPLPIGMEKNSVPGKPETLLPFFLMEIRIISALNYPSIMGDS